MLSALASLHVFSGEPIDPALGQFASYSPGWQSEALGYAPADNPYERGKRLSRRIAAPVLVFLLYETGDIGLSLYEGGRNPVYISTFSYAVNKGIFKVPGLVGYPEGHKRRFSELLSCADVKQLIALLEEFFGVALAISPDAAPETLARIRGDELYRAFHEQERKIRGRQAPIRAVLTEELTGKLFSSGPREIKRYLSNGFLFGMDGPESGVEELRPVRFAHGKLIPLADDEIVYATDEPSGDPFHPDIPPNTVRFTPEAPDSFRGKTLPLPPGFDFFDFLDDRRAMLVNDAGGVAFMDGDGKLVTRFSVKGRPVTVADGYLLTAGSGSGWMYMYDPASKIRIYRLEDRQNKSDQEVSKADL